jgi:murein L,D-transpeptidase YcbB/YkuD
MPGRSALAGRGQGLIGDFSSRDDSDHAERLTSRGLQESQKIVVTGKLSEVNWTEFGVRRGDVQEFYVSSNGTLFWLRGDKPTLQARSMIALFEKAEQKGLNPEDYDAPRWQSRVDRLDRSTPASEMDLVHFDVALTISTMRYVADLQLGRVNPRPVHFEFDLNRKRRSLATAAKTIKSKALVSNGARMAISVVGTGLIKPIRLLRALRELACCGLGCLVPWS